jgi:CheY-like chemotaxis protein
MVKPLKSPRIVMLIDDNEIDLKINGKIVAITKLFDDVIVCRSGEEALNYLKQHLTSPKVLPEFILLDIQMPEMSGFEFLEHYKKLPASFTEVCIIAMLSSTLDFSDIQRAEANPFVVKLLKKPLIPAVLQEVVKENLQR